VLAFASTVHAADIAMYRDRDGRAVYVNAEDRDLRTAVKQGGVAAGLRLVESRKHGLPEIDQYIETVARQQNLDPKLVRAVIEVESAWNVKARSRKGALGLMQLMPGTADEFHVRDPFDARENIRAGVAYLRNLLDRFDQNLTYALAAYNAGETAVAKRKGVPPFEETRTYLARISTLYGRLQAQAVPDRGAVLRSEINGRVAYTNLN
jgi:soluble lytic murein transglycosylase-like protein